MQSIEKIDNTRVIIQYSEHTVLELEFTMTICTISNQSYVLRVRNGGRSGFVIHLLTQLQAIVSLTGSKCNIVALQCFK